MTNLNSKLSAAIVDPVGVFLKGVKTEGLDLVIYGCGSYFFKSEFNDIDFFVSEGISDAHMDRCMELAASFTETFNIKIHVFGSINGKPVPEQERILLYNRGQILWGTR